MRFLLAFFLALSFGSAVLAQSQSGGGGYSDAQAIAAVSPLIPTPLTAVPPNPTPSGVPGSAAAGTYIPGNAATLTLCRRTSTTTAGDGSFVVTWATSLVSSSPWAGVDPVWANTTMPPVCWMKTISATGVTGQCSPTQTLALTLANVTAGLTVGPFGANSGAAGLTVKVHACEPTQ